MKTCLTLFIFCLITILNFNAFAINDGEWKYYEDTEFCFIQSLPIKTEIPDGKLRGKTYMLVYKIHKSPDLFVQITAGFNYKSSDSIDVKIDKGDYNFFTDEDTAWAEKDKKVIFAMKKGLELTAVGISNKGTKVVDTYNLKGFTSAINKLSKSC